MCSNSACTCFLGHCSVADVPRSGVFASASKQPSSQEIKSCMSTTLRALAQHMEGTQSSQGGAYTKSIQLRPIFILFLVCETCALPKTRISCVLRLQVHPLTVFPDDRHTQGTEFDMLFAFSVALDAGRGID